jgi:hypothetical protein
VERELKQAPPIAQEDPTNSTYQLIRRLWPTSRKPRNALFSLMQDASRQQQGPRDDALNHGHHVHAPRAAHNWKNRQTATRRTLRSQSPEQQRAPSDPHESFQSKPLLTTTAPNRRPRRQKKNFAGRCRTSRNRVGAGVDEPWRQRRSPRDVAPEATTDDGGLDADMEPAFEPPAPRPSCRRDCRAAGILGGTCSSAICEE